jgi:uncharacterized protein (DUF305 family)
MHDGPRRCLRRQPHRISTTSGDFNQYGSKAKNSGMVASHEKQMEKEHQASMAKLKSATGGAVDKAFAEEMSKHHQKALDMIKQAHLTDSKLKQTTDKMAAAQKQELAQLKTVR